MAKITEGTLATWTHCQLNKPVTLLVRVVEDVSSDMASYGGRYSGMVRCTKVGGYHTFLVSKSALVLP